MLTLPNPNQDIIKVECTNEDKETFEVLGKNERKKPRVPFYETHATGDVILVKIENLDVGEWTVTVTRSSDEQKLKVIINGMPFFTVF